MSAVQEDDGKVCKSVFNLPNFPVSSSFLFLPLRPYLPLTLASSFSHRFPFLFKILKPLQEINTDASYQVFSNELTLPGEIV